MSNITEDEWSSELDRLDTYVRVRWPWLVVRCTNGLSIEAASCEGRLSLTLDGRKSGLVTEIRMSSATSICGSIDDAEMRIQEARNVLDALHYLASVTSHIRVWPPGETPCDKCGGTGKEKSSKCRRCNGAGKR